MFLSLSFSLARSQTRHGTASLSDFSIDPKPGIRRSVYSCDTACVDGCVKFLPERTDPYQRYGLAGLVNAVPFEKLVDRYFENEKDLQADKKRGNTQVNFGFACGQSCAKRTDDNVREHFGTSVPSKLAGTDDPDVVLTFDLMSKIAKALGIEWCQDDFLEQNQEVRERIRLFAGTIDINNLWELMSFCKLVLKSGVGINYHFDIHNCKDLDDALVLSKILFSPKDNW